VRWCVARRVSRSIRHRRRRPGTHDHPGRRPRHDVHVHTVSVAGETVAAGADPRRRPAPVAGGNEPAHPRRKRRTGDAALRPRGALLGRRSLRRLLHGEFDGAPKTRRCRRPPRHDSPPGVSSDGLADLDARPEPHSKSRAKPVVVTMINRPNRSIERRAHDHPTRQRLGPCKFPAGAGSGVSAAVAAVALWASFGALSRRRTFAHAPGDRR